MHRHLIPTMAAQLTETWIASLVLNGLAVLSRKSPRAWRAWALFYLLSNTLLIFLDPYYHFVGKGWYTPAWIAQQVISTGLLVFVVREAVSPAVLLVGTGSMGAVGAGMATGQTPHWPNSSVELVMMLCGVASLALGIIAAIGAGARRTMHSAILAIFLLGYALLSLAGADYLKQPNIGIAWSLLECVCFGAWAINVQMDSQ